MQCGTAPRILLRTAILGNGAVAHLQLRIHQINDLPIPLVPLGPIATDEAVSHHRIRGIHPDDAGLQPCQVPTDRALEKCGAGMVARDRGTGIVSRIHAVKSGDGAPANRGAAAATDDPHVPVEYRSSAVNRRNRQAINNTTAQFAVGQVHGPLHHGRGHYLAIGWIRAPEDDLSTQEIQAFPISPRSHEYRVAVLGDLDGRLDGFQRRLRRLSIVGVVAQARVYVVRVAGHGGVGGIPPVLVEVLVSILVGVVTGRRRVGAKEQRLPPIGQAVPVLVGILVGTHIHRTTEEASLAIHIDRRQGRNIGIALVYAGRIHLQMTVARDQGCHVDVFHAFKATLDIAMGNDDRTCDSSAPAAAARVGRLDLERPIGPDNAVDHRSSAGPITHNPAAAIPTVV